MTEPSLLIYNSFEKIILNFVSYKKMNKHLLNKKGHGPLYRITAPKFDYTELQNEERMLDEFFENEDKAFQK